MTVTPPIIERFGGYALVADLGDKGRAWAGTVVRVVKPDAGRVQFPTFAMDMGWPFEMSEATTTLFERLGVKGCRFGAGYYPTTAKDFDERNADFVRDLKWAQKHNITVMLTVGEGGAAQPLNRPRPWLDEKGVMQDTKSDYAWMPELDPDFQNWSRLTAARFGWPKGPVNAIELWNEPWEGISISGWGADNLRFREMYERMGKGITEAREKDGVEVLIGGACSSSNTRDKLFSDGTDKFLPYLDFVSIHYQPLAADPAIEKMWANRKGKYGSVKTWDTESWIANSEDRVAGVLASMRAMGQERTAGIFAGNVFQADVLTDKPRIGITHAYPPAAAVAATQKFIGQRPFKEILFKNGLPWVFVFGDLDGRPDTGSVVVLGDLGAVYERRRTLFRTVEIDPNGGKLTLDSGDGQFVLHDFYGNPLPPAGRKIVVPLNGLGYFLRTNGKPGSFARLLDALKKSDIRGYAPVEIVAHDFTAPLTAGNSALRLTVTNILNRPVAGSFSLTFNGESVPMILSLTNLAPHETKTFSFPVPADKPSAENLYPLEVTFNAGDEGKATIKENLRVNILARKTITVDGDLAKWKDVIPQPIEAKQVTEASQTEQAYLPFIVRAAGKATDAKIAAVGYAAYDDNNFYFAAKIADKTPYPGNIRFATRDDDQYFYPEKSFVKAGTGAGFAVRWRGQIVAPATGTYKIATVTDDGARLWVNGKQLVNAWQDQGPTEFSGYVDLESGKRYDIKMEYYQGGGGAEARLRWQKPGQNSATEIIPNAALAASSDAAPGTGLTAAYYRDREMQTLVVTRTDKAVDFSWSATDLPDPKFGEATLQELKWPDGVRRFSYRKDPDLPAGAGTDNVQLAFNVLPAADKSWLPFPAGTMPRFMVYEDSDYEFALNEVAPAYGGGSEIWCLQRPGQTRKHYYPRQPKSPKDGGAVLSGKLVMKRDADSRIVECAIPWLEMPEVKKRIDAGQPIKFSFRINDNKGPSYELAVGRSVSKDNPRAFHNDWLTHWANEIEFGIGK